MDVIFRYATAGTADYAFFQHILKSMNPTTGRCAILFPHGVLSRNDELSMRKVLVQLDLVEAVIGIGKSLFYNSPMEACIIICRSKKTSQRRKKSFYKMRKMRLQEKCTKLLGTRAYT